MRNSRIRAFVRIFIFAYILCIPKTETPKDNVSLKMYVLLSYSGVPITRAGCIKQAGRIFLQILIYEQVLIRASRLEKIEILAVKLQAGRNFHDIFKNEQALLSEQGGFFFKF